METGTGFGQTGFMLMDIGLPGMSGIEGIKQVREILPEVPVIMLSVYKNDEHIFKSFMPAPVATWPKKDHRLN